MDSDSSGEDLFGYDGTIKTLQKLLRETDHKGTSSSIDNSGDCRVNSEYCIGDSEDCIEIGDNIIEIEDDDNDIAIKENVRHSTEPPGYEFEETFRVIFPMEVTQVHRFTMKPHDLLKSVFERLAELKNVTPDDIELIVSPTNRQVSPFDSLNSLEYSVTQIFHARIRGIHSSTEVNNGTGNIEINCKRLEKRSKPLIFMMHLMQPMDILNKMVARELRCDISDFKLIFDGETVQATDTCKSLDISSGDCMEIHMKK